MKQSGMCELYELAADQLWRVCLVLQAINICLKGLI